MSLDKTTIDNFLDSALQTLEYTLDSSECSTQDSMSKKIGAYVSAQYVAINTSEGSVYRLLIKLSSEPEKYERKIMKLWNAAHVVRYNAESLIDGNFEKKIE